MNEAPLRGPELELPGGERVPLDGPLVIGRDSEAGLVLTDAEASRRHAQIAVEAGAVILRDLESRNGTTVNGQRVSGACALADGDIVRIGQTQMVFHAPPMPEPPAPAPATDPELTVVAPLVQQTVRQEALPGAAAAPEAPGTSSPLQVLGRITRTIAGMDDARLIADTATRAIKDDYGCEGASLVLVDSAVGALYFASVASDSPGLKLITLHPGQGIVGRAIELGQPALVVDVSKDPGHAAGMDRSLGFTSKSIIAAPVTGADGAVIGALEAINPAGKPAFDADDLEFLVLVAAAVGPALAKASDWEAIERERAALARVAGIREQYVAKSPAMVRLLMEAAALHEAKTPVYLAGEPGTGRTMLARLIHEAAGAVAPLALVGRGNVPVSAPGALLVEDLEQFSVEEQADLATLLAGAEGRQSAFLTGSQSLLSLLSAGRISPELHERLEAGQLIIPPLRSRPDELEPLVARFAAETAEMLRRERFTFGEDALARLRTHSWPGNVRELRDVVRRIGILARESTIEPATIESLTPELAEAAPETMARAQPPLERRRAALLEQTIVDAESGDEADRVSAAQALARVPVAEATSALRGLLDDESALVRASAADGLAGRADAAEALAAHLEREVDLGVALSLMEALAATGEAARHPVVERALRAGDARMRRLAVRALRGGPNARDTAEAVRDDPDPTVRIESLAALIEAGEPLEAELDAFAEEGTPAVRAAACEALGGLGLATDRLLALTANGDRSVRVAAIRALGSSQSADAKSVLLELLSDVTVSAEAASALGMMGASEAVPRLVALLNAPEAPLATRRAVVQALARIGGEQAADAIEEALTDPALMETALEAAESLAVPLDPAVLEARTRELLRAGSTSPSAAVEALEALVALADRVGEPAAVVRATLPSADDPETRALALEFLLELDDPAALPVFVAYPDDAPPGSLNASADAAVPALLAALEGDHADEATEVLANMGPRVVPQLLAALGDPALSRSATRALMEIGQASLPYLVSAIEAATPAELPPLLQVLGKLAPGRLANYVATFLDAPESPVRYSAMVALGNLPDTRSESELLARLNSDDPATAMLATLALGRIQSADAFEALSIRVGAGERRAQYALAGAVNEYNLRQGPVLEIVQRMVREGLPFSSGALESAVTSGAVTDNDVLAALAADDVPQTQKLRLLSAVGRLDAAAALPLLLAVLRANPGEPVLGAAAAALTRHELVAREQIAALVLESATREAGLAVLARMQDPRALLSVLRRLRPSLEVDASLGAALHAMGDLVLGPLIDVVSENWDLESLSLFWQLTEVVGPSAP